MRLLPHLALVAAVAAVLLASGSACRSSGAARNATDDLFVPVAQVLRHPRCLNCHPSGDRPHVGDDARLHAMEVQRGPAGFGVPAMHCGACHRDANQDGALVPGAPHWHLAPRSMGWVGLDDHELAAALQDRARNGNRSLAEIREHLAEDPLVLWGWDPGIGREAVPMRHDAFLAAFDAWVAAGAPLPEPGTISNF